MTAERSIEVHALHWRGVDTEITFERNWLQMPRSEEGRVAHLTVTARSPERAPLPITETGFRSHFLHPEKVAEAGGPVAYVATWLDQMARSREWIAYEKSSRQLSLF